MRRFADIGILNAINRAYSRPSDRLMPVFPAVMGGTGLGLVITQNWLMKWAVIFRSIQPAESWFNFLVPHINLDLNPNIIIEGPSTQCLAGKRTYVEPNSAAAQCTLDILSETPLEVVYSPTFSRCLPRDTT